MDCPICKHSGIEAGVSTCPQCQSDIEIFTILSKLDAQIKKLKTWLLVFGIAGVLGIGLLVAAYFKIKNKTVLILNQYTEIYSLKQQEAGWQKTVDELRNQLEEKNKEIENLKAQPQPQATLSPSPDKGDKTSLIIQQGQSLWKIAEKELGDGFQYARLAKENGIKNPDLIITGAEIVIKK